LENTGSSVVVKLTANGAATEQVTGMYWIVEQI